MLNRRDAWIWHALAVAWLGVAAALASVPIAKAVQPEEVLEDPKLESRAREISAGLRCLVCQNQSIADSHSFLAEDMRNVVEKRVRLGESDDEVRAYMQAKYGDFVLMKPPVKLSTFLLWFGPLLLVLAGGVWYIFAIRKTDAEPSPVDLDLSEDERRKLDDLLKRSTEEETTS